MKQILFQAYNKIKQNNGIFYDYNKKELIFFYIDHENKNKFVIITDDWVFLHNIRVMLEQHIIPVVKFFILMTLKVLNANHK